MTGFFIFASLLIPEPVIPRRSGGGSEQRGDPHSVWSSPFYTWRLPVCRSFNTGMAAPAFETKCCLAM